jgi:hypothetical protein
LEHRCEEADVRDRQSFNAVTAPIGSSPSEVSASNMTPAEDDAGLIALEMQSAGRLLSKADVSEAQPAIA